MVSNIENNTAMTLKNNINKKIANTIAKKNNKSNFKFTRNTSANRRAEIITLMQAQNK